MITEIAECRCCAIAQRVSIGTPRNEDMEPVVADVESHAEDMEPFARDMEPFAGDIDPVTEDTDYIAEDIQEEAVVISGRTLEGLMVLPRRHVATLEDLPVISRAHVLATIRRASLSIQERTFGSAIRVAVMSGPPASAGHVCFHVTTRDSEDMERIASRFR